MESAYIVRKKQEQVAWYNLLIELQHKGIAIDSKEEHDIVNRVRAYAKAYHTLQSTKGEKVT